MTTDFVRLSDARAARFLQTLLLIDDGVNFTPRTEEAPATAKELISLTPEALADARRASKAQRTATAETAKTGEGPAASGPVAVGKPTVQSAPKYPIEADRLTEASALKGLICGVIKPREGDVNVADHVLLAAQKADICILDWNTYEDDGASTRELITKLIPQNKRDDRYRVICIYSGESESKAKVTLVLDALKAAAVTDFVTVDNGFSLQRGYTKICWYSKEQTQAEKADKLRERSVVDLPETLITEFAAIDRGLMTNFALAALTAVREKTQNILAKFESRLDPAFLSHRSLQPAPSDSEEHMLAVFVSELESVLDEDPKVRESVSAASSMQRVLDFEERGKIKLHEGCGADTPEVARAWITTALTHGLESTRMSQDFPELKERLKALKSNPGPCLKSLSKIFRKNAPDDFVIDADFAMLLSLRSRYPGAPEPILSLGSILQKKGEPNSFWLCTQPLCDSVRLQNSRVFPMAKLRGSDKSFDIVIKSQGLPKRLRASVKLYDSAFPSFSPTEGCIRPIKNDEGYLEYVDDNGSKYIWVAELRLPQALRFSGLLAQESSRIGLTEAEWLRRQSGSDKGDAD